MKNYKVSVEYDVEQETGEQEHILDHFTLEINSGDPEKFDICSCYFGWKNMEDMKNLGWHTMRYFKQYGRRFVSRQGKNFDYWQSAITRFSYVIEEIS